FPRRSPTYAPPSDSPVRPPDTVAGLAPSHSGSAPNADATARANARVPVRGPPPRTSAVPTPPVPTPTALPGSPTHQVVDRRDLDRALRSGMANDCDRLISLGIGLPGISCSGTDRAERGDAAP